MKNSNYTADLIEKRELVLGNEAHALYQKCEHFNMHTMLTEVVREELERAAAERFGYSFLRMKP